MQEWVRIVLRIVQHIGSFPQGVLVVCRRGRQNRQIPAAGSSPSRAAHREEGVVGGRSSSVKSGSVFSLSPFTCLTTAWHLSAIYRLGGTGARMRRTIIEKMTTKFVNHNGLLVDGRQILDVMSQYCACLGYWTGDGAFPVTIPGSASLLRYKGRYLMACTRHQLDLVGEPEGVCLMLPHNGTSKCITSGGSITFDGELNDGDHHQIALFDFTEPALAEPEIRPLFLDFRGQHPTVPAANVVAVAAYGYPFEGRLVDYDEGRIGLSKQSVLCRFVGQGSDDAVHVIDPLEPLAFSPDGMSGGPAFGIIMESGGFSVHFAGIIVRGSRERFRVIKAGAVEMMMNNLIRMRPSAIAGS